MIYIHKNQLPNSLSQYTETQVKSGLTVEYSGNWDKNEFRDIVVKEQSKLCCYCNSAITAENSTIEHFLPESVFKEEVASYFNLFLACNDGKRKDTPKREQHCDASTEAKGDKIIPKYITHSDCELFFAYNHKGEILPFCQFKDIESCIKNYGKLTDEERMVLATIEVLKLNVNSLTARRKNVYNVCISNIPYFFR